MTWTGSGRKTAVLGAAVLLLGALAVPANAAPLPPALQVPAERVPAAPDLPSPDQIAAAKSSESATAAQVTTIDQLLADASAAQDAGLSASLQANNAYGEALVELQSRRDAAEVAAAKAAAAGAEHQKTRQQIGQLAGDLYRHGGLNPALSSFVSGSGNALQQAATLEAVTAGRTRAFQSAETAAVAAESLTAAAADANRAADEAARTAESRKRDAEQANDAQRQGVSEAKAQRTLLVEQLATLKNTTVVLESARIDALDRQRQEDQLAAVTAAAAQDPSQNQVPAQAAAPRTDAGNASSAAPAGGNQTPQSPAPAAPATAQPAPAVPAGPVRPAPVLPAPAPVAGPSSAPSPRPAAPPAPTPAPAPAPAPAPGGSNQTAISVALGKVGSPYFYQYGGTGPHGFDCSGLVQNAFAAAGKYLPRTASQQFAQAPVHVPLAQARAGDLLVWGSAPGFYHVAIYLGGGRVVQALNEDAGLTVTDLASMAGMQLYPVAARY
ncbi:MULTISPECIES: C40 family peptidase [unclassified Arthrobacter]|uniref:C40 family peptidase n=1 Tax=unclassified Arthrobacter TaxID=235627 RepID=UPI002E0867B6|nr:MULTISPECIES: C40 family peptidase [unclassified Arthrobacter]MEC5192541.1 cell wall-associated NlpC family hydrolase [Arthrobacter sp. MP_M4]MEC5204025.1 cell wall-associated NlpC family hydrolase [Arthrobacter sp. MP_M7]